MQRCRLPHWSSLVLRWEVEGHHMRQGRNHSHDHFRHTASQLAEMGYCERKMLLRLQYGPRASLSRLVAQERGTTQHAQFLAEARRLNPRVFNDAPMQLPSAPAMKCRRLRDLLVIIVGLFMKFGAGKR